MLVYDITRRATFESVKKWLRELRQFGSSDMVVILLGNKLDLGHSREVSQEEGNHLAEEEGLCFMETSALEKLNVEEAFLLMITKIHEITSQKSLEAKADEILTKQLGGGEKIISIDEVTATKRSSTCCSK